MSNRVTLLVNASGFSSGVRYRIYRGDASPVGTTAPLIEVDEETVKKRVRTITDMPLTQRADAASCFDIPHFFLLLPVPQVYVDGELLPSDSITFFQNQKMVRINRTFDYPTTSVVTMDYQYLQGVVIDDCMQIQDGVKHYGIEVPTGLNPPSTVAYTLDHVTSELKIRPTHDATSLHLFYNVEFQETRTGKTRIATDQEITLTPDPADCRWQLEISKDDGNSWEMLEGLPLSAGEFVLSDLDKITDQPHIPLPYTITPITSGAVEVRIRNPWYLWRDNHRDTHLYRIKTIDSMEQESAYKVFPRGRINFRPTELIVRRRWDNGAPAARAGDDAITLRTFTEATVGSVDSEIVFIDDHLTPGYSYSYTFHLDDDQGFLTPPFWTVVDMPV